MDANDTIAQLRQWVDSSGGRPIEIAPEQTNVFQSHAVFSAEDVSSIEQQLHCKLPDSYRQFMAMIGESSLFQDPTTKLGICFFKPADVILASNQIWDEEFERTEDRFCFIGALQVMGDYFGFTTTRRGPQNFDVYCHEYPPGEYVSTSDELKSWRTFDSWLVRLVESRGKRSL